VLVLVGRERLVNPRLWLRGQNSGGQP